MSIGFIIKRLKKPHTKLAKLEQDNINLVFIKLYIKKLINKSIFLYKDKGIKVYIAYCLTNILYFFTLNMPYIAPELHSIF